MTNSFGLGLAIVTVILNYEVRAWFRIYCLVAKWL